MNVLVLGGSGFIGSSIAAYLSRVDAVCVYTYSRMSDGELSLSSLIELIDSYEISYIINCIGAIGPDAVNPFDNQVRSNIIILDIIVQAINLSRLAVSLVHIGSAAEYGFKESVFHESDLAAPVSDYGKSKLVATKLLLNRPNLSGGAFINLRVFNLFGANVPDQTFTGNLIQKASAAFRGSLSVKVMSNLSLRDYVYIDDLSRFVLDLVSGNLVLSGDNCLINFCSGRPLSMDGFISIVSECLPQLKFDLVNTSSPVKSCYGCNRRLRETGFSFRDDFREQVSNWVRSYRFYE